MLLTNRSVFRCLLLLAFLAATALNSGHTVLAKEVPPPPGKAALFASLALPEALRQAASQKKLVMVDFFTTWCGPCKMLDETTWKDDKVVAWIQQRAVAIKVDCDRNEALAKQYRIGAYPTVVFLQADGKEVGRLVGYLEPAAFLSAAPDVLSGKTASMRMKEKLEGGHENDPMLRQQYGRALGEEGKYAEALQQYLWCFDHGLEFQPAYVGVRLSYLIADILGLAEQYPAARQALADRKQALATAILTPSATARQAYDLTVLSEALGETGQTLKIYDTLLTRKDASKEALSVLFSSVFADLLQARRYQDIVHGPQDPQQMMDREFTQFYELKKYMDQQSATAPKEMAQAAAAVMDKQKSEVLSFSCGVYEALLGMHQSEAAKKAAAAILRFDSSPQTYQQLGQHAERSGDAAAAKAWRAEKAP